MTQLYIFIFCSLNLLILISTLLYRFGYTPVHAHTTDPGKFWALEHNTESKEMMVYPQQSFREATTMGGGEKWMKKRASFSGLRPMSAGAISDISDYHSTHVGLGMSNTWASDSLFKRSGSVDTDPSKTTVFDMGKTLGESLGGGTHISLGDSIKTNRIYTRSAPSTPTAPRSVVAETGNSTTKPPADFYSSSPAGNANNTPTTTPMKEAPTRSTGTNLNDFFDRAISIPMNTQSAPNSPLRHIKERASVTFSPGRSLLSSPAPYATDS